MNSGQISPQPTNPGLALSASDPMEAGAESPVHSLRDVAVIIRRHTHEVRNALNGMELELMLLAELADEPPLRDALKRLREARAEIARHLNGLSSKYGMEPPSLVPAIQIAERWNVDSRDIATRAPVQWSNQLAAQSVCVEVGLLRSLLKDVLAIAVRVAGGRPLRVCSRCEDGSVLFEITVESDGTSGNVDGQQAYWTALVGLANRGQIQMWPKVLTDKACFPLQIRLPLLPPDK